MLKFFQEGAQAMERVFCEYDGYVIVAKFQSGRQRLWWPMNEDEVDGRYRGSPCWSRKQAEERFELERSNPEFRNVELALMRFQFDMCTRTMDASAREVVIPWQAYASRT